MRTLALAAEPAGHPMCRLAASWTAMLTSFAECRGLAVAFVEALAQAEHQPELRPARRDLPAQLLDPDTTPSGAELVDALTAVPLAAH